MSNIFLPEVAPDTLWLFLNADRRRTRPPRRLPQRVYGQQSEVLSSCAFMRLVALYLSWFCLNFGASLGR
jgi:hypothetical protein